jgi:hypothetical protein
VNDFLGRGPDFPAFLSTISFYDDILAELSSTPHVSAVGCVLVDTKPALRTLSKEAVEWSERFLEGLQAWVSEQANAMMEFFEDARVEVEKPVSTLDDVLCACLCVCGCLRACVCGCMWLFWGGERVGRHGHGVWWGG